VATLITRDFYLHWRPQAGQSSQVRCGRIAVIAVFVLGALWAPVIGQFHSLWIYLQSVGAYLMMPFVGVFFLGVLWRRVTAAGVWASVLSGFILGPLLMIDQQRPYLPLLQTPIMRPWLHGAILEFAVCLTVLVVVSLSTEPQPPASLAATTFDWSGGLQNEEAPVRGLRDYRVWLVVVVSITAALWFVMR
jgi:SSS family solute:Na+ symporter